MLSFELCEKVSEPELHLKGDYVYEIKEDGERVFIFINKAKSLNYLIGEDLIN